MTSDLRRVRPLCKRPSNWLNVKATAVLRFANDKKIRAGQNRACQPQRSLGNDECPLKQWIETLGEIGEEETRAALILWFYYEHRTRKQM